MKKLKKFLKNNKTLFSFFLRIYQMYHRYLFYRIERWREVLFDSKSIFWKEKTENDIKEYWKNATNVRKNSFLESIIMENTPETVMEVGCNCGNNLYALGKKFKETKFVGIDINPRAILMGKKWIKEEGIENIHLIERRAEYLSIFEDNSFDVVFSWATLIYPRPSSIENIMKNLLRISKKKLYLLEMQAEKSLSKKKRSGVYCNGNWKRDYVSIIKNINENIADINVEWIPSDIWQPGGCGGAIISVNLEGLK